MSKVFKETNYITLPGFAIVRMKLSGNELICYSLIYGFTQDNETEFAGSLSYISSALNVTKQNALAILNRLVKKGLIEKREEKVNGVKLCRYCISNSVTETITGIAESATGGIAETITPPIAETATINNNSIDNTIFDNIDNNIFPQSEIPEKKCKGTSEKICLFSESKYYDIELFRAQFTKDKKYANADIEYYYEAVKNWSAGSGKKKRDWIATARNFMLSDMQKGRFVQAARGGMQLSDDDITYLSL